MIKRVNTPIIVLTILLMAKSSQLYAQQKDSAAVKLENVTISDTKTPSDFGSSLPVQTLSAGVLQQINALSVGDAARYFSGVLVKDYGGAGGLKTVSVRGLGAANTGIVYDGIPVSDVQTGQIDLSRYSSSFISSMSLYQAQPADMLSPARSFASSAILDIRTNDFDEKNLAKPEVKAGLQTGSFGLWQPNAGFRTLLSKKTLVSAEMLYLHSKGNYPYMVHNGNLTERSRRDNSQIGAIQAEMNLKHAFADSSILFFKSGFYNASRGLPGVVIFFNPHSAEKLWNRNVFLQSRYNRPIDSKTDLSVAAKYSGSFTRYRDPKFQNNAGGIDDKYRNYEWYISAALKRSLGRFVTTSLANDFSYDKLLSNKRQFVFPTRKGMWNSFSLQYKNEEWKINVTLLNTYFNDHTKTGTGSGTKDRITPTVSVGFKPAPASPFYLRAFFKQIYRMPTFNDLYYNLIGNRDLKPESTDQYNLGITWSGQPNKHGNRINISIDGYYNTIKDKIITYPNRNLFIWSMLNLGRVRITGLDLNAESNIRVASQWSLFSRLAYTYQQAIDITNRSSATYKNRIPYTPDHSGSGIFLLTHQSWTFGYSFLFSGSRYALGANDPTNRLAGWMTHDVSVSKAIKINRSEIALKVGVDNLTDKRYDVVRFYPMPGRSGMVKVSYTSKK